MAAPSTFGVGHGQATMAGLEDERGRRHLMETKLGVLLWSQAASWDEFEAAARRVDELGYDHLWAWDHLYAIFGEPEQAIFEGYTTLAAWAKVTSRTRLGLLVGANTFRNPALVA
jgi:alkanesulfonate monooxygenase SsuD/methylene tetrahydromethanopterin reductase-like flavin-dependent oxidoreductase (luciferase family)